MKIVLIGAGNLATNLGKALLNADHDILQVYSRKFETASDLANIVGGSPTDDIDRINANADVYIVSLKDSVLGEIIPKVCRGKEQKVFVHTAGSIDMDVFMGMSKHYGVLYPMQTFSKEKEVNFIEIPCFIEANDDFAKTVITELAQTISNNVSYLSTDDRKYLHLSAVFACNFVNHCYDMASQILASHGISFDVLLPLIDETANKVHSLNPHDSQTGPAVRYDENVIRMQSSLLKANPMMKDLYDRMSLNIHHNAIKDD